VEKGGSTHRGEKRGGPAEKGDKEFFVRVAAGNKRRKQGTFGIVDRERGCRSNAPEKKPGALVEMFSNGWKKTLN